MKHPNHTSDQPPNGNLGLELSTLIRLVMRSTVSDAPTGRMQEALADFLREAHDNTTQSLSEVIADTQDRLCVSYRDNDEHDRIRIELAQTALMYLLERSATDPAAKGRASQRWRSVLHSMEELENFRQGRGVPSTQVVIGE